MRASRLLNTLLFLFLFIISANSTSEIIPERKIDFRLLSDESGSGPLKVWIFFEEEKGSSAGSRIVSERALKRMRLRGSSHGFPASARKVRKEYLGEISGRVERIRNISNYFNAASAEVKRSNLGEIAELSFVRKIEPVAVFHRFVSRFSRDTCSESYPDRQNSTRYGESLEQLDLIQSTDLLELGINGSGASTGYDPVRICLLDTGFNLDHEALEHIRVIAQRDFVQGDSVTSNQAGDHPDQDRHGTLVLGAAAGYMEGSLIGPAWGAEYILGKTEIYDREIIIEEDNWVAGLEWADSAGADIVSSSLGYFEWYSNEDMDGETALTTRAADRAAAAGILVVNAVGNQGFEGDTSLIAPSDADSIIAVGAVYGSGDIVYSSSRGPSADGRIKPEVVAMGANVYSVDPGTYNGYAGFSGTSLATPLVAGACAQVLETNPYLTVMELRDKILGTATRSSSPDNSYGYGIVQGLAASGLQIPERGSDITIDLLSNNPFGDNIKFRLYAPQWIEVSVNLYDCRGRLVKNIIEYEVIKFGLDLDWDGTNNSGEKVDAGIYFLSVFSGEELVKNRKLVLIP
ncbi:MAG: S8 family serine peptidase [Candidatus Krumholzibacteriales bacterium]